MIEHRTSRRDWKRWYAALRNNSPDAFRNAIQAAEGISITHHLSTEIAAELEISHVMLACTVLGISLSANSSAAPSGERE
jgi:hypothetical protein